MVFLQSFAAALSQNVTGVPGGLRQQMAHWQAFEAFQQQLLQTRQLARAAADMLDRIVTHQEKYEGLLQKALEESLASSSFSMDSAAVFFSDVNDSSGPSWLLLTFTLLAGSMVILAIDAFLFRRTLWRKLTRQ